MNPSSDAVPVSPAPSQRSRLACGLLAVGGLLLCWFGLASLLTAGLAGLLFASLPSMLGGLLGLAILAGLLLVPLVGSLMLARRPGWAGLKPLGLSLLLVAGYALVAIAIRAGAGGNSGLESILRLVVLTPVGLVAGETALRAAGVPRSRLLDGFGYGVPPLTGLLLSCGLIGLLTLGWPLSGALGDSWASLGLLGRGLAIVLPEELIFRGAVLGIFAHSSPQRKAQAAALSLLVYLAFIPTQVLPASDWEALVLLIVLPPLALLTTQLRALTGSIWAGVLLAWFYRAIPWLFTDPRDEILEPAQWLAWGGMLLGAGVLALLLWGGRKVLAPRWRPSQIATLGLFAFLAVSVCGGWWSVWVFAGEPGFHDDGFIVMMEEQADLSAAYDIADPFARRAYVYEMLVQTAEKTQAPVRARLEELGLSYRPYYLVNMIRVEGHHRQREEFASLPGVAYVMVNPNVRPYPAHVALGTMPAPEEGRGVEWNVKQVGADAVWGMGYRGQGVVIGGQDSGYDWEHPALQRSYRGWDVETGRVAHDYNWHDAWDDTPVPHDDGDHGTHTMGTMVGDDGRGNQIGVAPGARWVGCRNMRRGIGNPASYVECAEFFLAPYSLGGDPFRDGDVTRSPDVVNNSWGCPDFEGCEDDTLKPAVEAMRAAGIMMVVSAGNEGPACKTVAEPPARYDAAFSVGATDSSGEVVFFSSRGPVPTSDGGEPLLKPDIVAPGSNVRSSLPGNRYGSAGGTSMAGPHVAGTVALLWSARPDLRGNVEATEEIIYRSARPVEVSATCSPAVQAPADDGFFAEILAAMDAEVCACGDVGGVPNNVYGWGEINALRAVQTALER
jgi:serine protease AprX